MIRSRVIPTILPFLLCACGNHASQQGGQSVARQQSSLLSGGGSWIREYAGACTPVGTSNVKQLPDGDFVFGGQLGSADFCLARVTPEGNLSQRSYGGVANERWLSEIEVLPDGFAFVGATFSFGTGDADGWLFRTDPTGSIVFQQLIGSVFSSGARAWDHLTSVIRLSDGNYLLSGRRGSGIPNNAWFVKVDPTGNLLAEKLIGLGSDITKLALLSNGTVAALGNNIVRLLDQNLNVIWEQSVSLQFVDKLRETADGNLLITAMNGGFANTHLIKLDSTGNVIWQKAFDLDPRVNDISTDTDGLLLVGRLLASGPSPETADALIIRMDNLGEIVWQRSFDGGDFDEAISGTGTTEGNFVVTGIKRIPGIPSPETRTVVLKLDADGNAGTECTELDEPSVSTIPGTASFQAIASATASVSSQTDATAISAVPSMPSLIEEICEGPPDNSPPVVAASGGGTFELGSTILLGGEVSDADGDLLHCAWTVDANPDCSGDVQSVSGGAGVALAPCEVGGLGLGTHTARVEVSDGTNGPVSAQLSIQIVDSTIPTLAPVASTYMLWPPNHQMVDVTIQANAADNSGVVHLSAAVSSNEPADGLGDGDTSPDWTDPVIDEAAGTVSIQLRSERFGGGDGRVYSVVITATDDAGNASSSTVDIKVPHSKGKN